MAEIDGDVIGDVAPNDRICGNSRILDADVYAGAFKHEPHDAEYCTARLHASHQFAQHKGGQRVEKISDAFATGQN